jgi:hypothetical protein
MKMKRLNNQAKGCVLCPDEMSLKSFRKTFLPAKNVLVLMAHGIHAHWRQPLTNFFLHSSCPAGKLKTMIDNKITKYRP